MRPEYQRCTSRWGLVVLASTMTVLVWGCGSNGIIVDDDGGSQSAEHDSGTLPLDSSAEERDAALVEPDVARASDDAATTEEANQAPAADAGLDREVHLGSLVRLSGLRSTDPDGDTITYRWIIASRPAASAAALTGADTATPSFIGDRVGQYVIELVVDDGTWTAAPDQVIVRVVPSDTDLTPTADAGPDRFAVTGQTLITLDASGSNDPENTPLNYLWIRAKAPEGSTAALDTNTPAMPTFRPDRDGEYVFRLQVTDGTSLSNWDEVRILADAAATVAVTGGAAQSGPVSNALGSALQVTVTNTHDLPVSRVRIQFSVLTGNGSVSPQWAYTDDQGVARTNLTLGTQSGVNSVLASCTSCSKTQEATIEATGTPGPARSIVLLTPTDTPVEQIMEVEAKLIDEHGNIASSDAARKIRITATGAGQLAFASATRGTVESGLGTSSVLVSPTEGRAVLELTNDTAELVTFAASGSDLEWLGTPLRLTLPTQDLACRGGVNTFSFDLSDRGAPMSNGTLTVQAQADLNAFFEVIYLSAEDSSGTSYGELFEDGSCTLSAERVIVPRADLESYASDNLITFVFRTDSSVSCSCSANTIAVEFSLFVQTRARFF
jgi:hypothetical protein